MKLNIFSDDWRGTRSENTFLRIVIPLLIIAQIATGVALVVRDRETILVPPNINETMKISRNYADTAYKKTWGLHVANLLGNVTPNNVDFLNEQLSNLVDATTYHRMKSEMATQIVEIKQNNVTVDFEASQVMYEPESGKVFVLGKSQTSGTAGKQIKEARVFELVIDISGGRPLVTEISSYVGEARTAEVMEKLERHRLVKEANDAKKNPVR